MSINDYHFITQWRIQATMDEVVAVLGDVLGLPRWWPAVYLEVKELARGDENGIGREIELYTKGWLPYTLRWRFLVTEISTGRIVLTADGDFVGRGIWTLTQTSATPADPNQADAWVEITYDWQIRARKPLLRSLSFLFKPIFAANHHWAMRKGEESLRLEIARRRAPNDAARAQIAPPPGPTPQQIGPWVRSVLRRAP